MNKIFKRFFPCFAIFLLLFFIKEFAFNRWDSISWIRGIILPSFVFGVISSFLIPYAKNTYKNKNEVVIGINQKIIEKKKIIIKVFIVSFAIFFVIFSFLFIKNYLKKKEIERLYIRQKEERILNAKQNFRTETKKLVSKFLDKELGIKFGHEKCWTHLYNQEYFCTKINKINIFEDAPTKAYVSLVSENQKNTSHVSKGLLRFIIFELNFDINGYSFFDKFADSDFFENGKFGTSAYTTLNFVKLGKDFYGWDLREYYMAQGWSFGEKKLYIPYFFEMNEYNNLISKDLKTPVFKIKPALSLDEFGFDGDSYSTDFSVEAIIEPEPDENKKYYDLKIIYKQIKGEKQQPNLIFNQIKFDKDTGEYIKTDEINKAENNFKKDYSENYNPNRDEITGYNPT